MKQNAKNTQNSKSTHDVKGPKKSRIELHGELPFWPFGLGIWADLPARAKAVYPVLIYHSDFDKLQSFPSLRTIAKIAGISKTTAYRATEDLQNVGMISKVSGDPHNTNCYLIMKTPPKLYREGGGSPRRTSAFHLEEPQCPTQKKQAAFHPEGTEPALINEHHTTTGVVGSNHIKDEDADEKIAARTQRHTDHIMGIQPGWDRQQTYQAMLELTRSWDDQEIKEVIEKHGKAAKNVGLIRHYLNKRSTIKDKKSQQQRQEKERQDRNRDWEEAKKNAASPEKHHQFYQEMITMLKS